MATSQSFKHDLNKNKYFKKWEKINDSDNDNNNNNNNNGILKNLPIIFNVVLANSSIGQKLSV